MARILLADDDAATLDLMSRSLATDGHQLMRASDGQEALDMAKSAPAAIDVLVTDVQMPIVDGIALAEQLLAVNANLRVVFMSGLQSEIARADRIKGRKIQFLLKPVSLEQLRAAVREAMR